MKGAEYIADRVAQNPLAGESRTLYEQARAFARKHVEGARRENEDAARLLVRELGKAGLLLHIGRPFELTSIVAIREALAYEHGLLDLAFAMQGLGSHAIFLAGSDEQRALYVGGAQRGEKIAAFAVTESEAGSDLAGVRTEARRRGENYVLEGSKLFISNGSIADYFVVLARTDPGGGIKGLSLFIVERTDAGFEVARRQEVIAYHPLAEVRFRQCAIPLSRRVGAEGEGYKLVLAVLETFRTSVAGAALGMAERALAEALDHVQARQQFGCPLAEQQAVQGRLADMAMEVEAARLMTYRAARRRDEGTERIPLESASAKVLATESAQRVIDSAVQLLGGRGVEKGSVTERLYREIRSLRIYEGATDILKLIVAGQLLR